MTLFANKIEDGIGELLEIVLQMKRDNLFNFRVKKTYEEAKPAFHPVNPRHMLMLYGLPKPLACI